MADETPVTFSEAQIAVIAALIDDQITARRMATAEVLRSLTDSIQAQANGNSARDEQLTRLTDRVEGISQIVQRHDNGIGTLDTRLSGQISDLDRAIRVSRTELMHSIDSLQDLRPRLETAEARYAELQPKIDEARSMAQRASDADYARTLGGGQGGN